MFWEAKETSPFNQEVLAPILSSLLIHWFITSVLSRSRRLTRKEVPWSQKNLSCKYTYTDLELCPFTTCFIRIQINNLQILYLQSKMSIHTFLLNVVCIFHLKEKSKLQLFNQTTRKLQQWGHSCYKTSAPSDCLCISCEFVVKTQCAANATPSCSRPLYSL